MPIPVKEAVQYAQKYLSDVMNIEQANLLLEEVELTEDQQYWLVTLSFPVQHQVSAVAAALGGTSVTRDYKIVKLQADTGVMVSVKIRKI
jgi:hypothetical protein